MLRRPNSDETKKRRRGAFFYPNDGRRTGFFSGLKDILTGKGPDMYIGKNRELSPAMRQWARWEDRMPERIRTDIPESEDDGESLSDYSDDGFARYKLRNGSAAWQGRDNWRTPFWAKRGAERYDIRTRRYRVPPPAIPYCARPERPKSPDSDYEDYVGDGLGNYYDGRQGRRSRRRRGDHGDFEIRGLQEEERDWHRPHGFPRRASLDHGFDGYRFADYGVPWGTQFPGFRRHFAANMPFPDLDDHVRYRR